ncbi:hypothetical protein [Pleomorphochaeta sp. DL1XJH-081]|uniref:hypothetical protein n=1 Tax=Pleomorphochaeta sp. DL1XJH-081 TaxID=3409690 RepID=UPI003BB55B34
MKSDDMAKSWVAQMASQTMGIILQTRQEIEEQTIQRMEESDWLRMRIEDLEEEVFALQAELENEKDERANLQSHSNVIERERNQFRDCWFKSKKKIVDLEMELNSIKKSDGDASDIKEITT